MTERKKSPKKKSKKVLVLRTCAADMTSHGGFKWPAKGPVKCDDWSPRAECGNGLHGLLWGEGDGSLLSFTSDAKWLVVEVDAATVVDLKGKVKFPAGVVVFCGDRKAATDWLSARAPGRAIVGAFSTSGDRGTSTSGDRGTSTSGYRGTSTSGDGGTSTSGDGGILNIRWWDGNRYRIATFYVGENGIEANQPYRVDDKGQPVKVGKETP